MRIWLLGLAVLTLVPTASLTPTCADPGTANQAANDRNLRSSGFEPSRYRLVWDDEFDRLSLSDNFPTTERWQTHFGKWNVRNLPDNGDKGVKVADWTPLVSGRTVAEALKSVGDPSKPGGFLHVVTKGTLKLHAYTLPERLQSEFWGFPYVASMISGESSFHQAYGYWEVRLRLNHLGKGHHFALWLVSTDAIWPPEIDLLEVVGTNPHQFTANLNDGGKTKPAMKFYEEPSTPDGFHVFGLQRTPEVIRWMIDGHVIRETPELIGQKELYLIASFEIASRWPGNPDETTPWPAEVEIDYVRIYAPP